MITFDKALKVMEHLLQGKTAKQATHDADVSYGQITATKKKFPLFLGLPRKYGKDKKDE